MFHPAGEGVGCGVGVGDGELPHLEEAGENLGVGVGQGEFRALVVEGDFDLAIFGGGVADEAERVVPALGGTVQAVGREAKILQHRQGHFEGGVGLHPQAAGLGVPVFDEEIVAGFFNEGDEGEGGKQNRNHDDHEDAGAWLRAAELPRGDGRRAIGRAGSHQKSGKVPVGAGRVMTDSRVSLL